MSSEDRMLRMAAAEAAEAARDLMLASLAPSSEFRVAKIGCAAEAIALVRARVSGGILGRDGSWRFSYRNHRGEVAERRVVPLGLRWGVSEWYPEPGWLLRALDLDRGEEREFALAGFVAPSPP